MIGVLYRVNNENGSIGAPPNFNQNVYYANNPDVAAAVKAGKESSGAAHYDRDGAREGRIYLPNFPSDFNAVAYLKLNPDVAGAVAAGAEPSAQSHYQRDGINEGRPYKPGMPAMVTAPATSPAPPGSPTAPGSTLLTPINPATGLPIGPAVPASAAMDDTPFYKKPVYIGGAALAALALFFVARKR